MPEHRVVETTQQFIHSDGRSIVQVDRLADGSLHLSVVLSEAGKTDACLEHTIPPEQAAAFLRWCGRQ